MSFVEKGFYVTALKKMGFGIAGWGNLFDFERVETCLNRYEYGGCCMWSGEYGLEEGDNGVARLALLDRDEFYDQLQVALHRVERHGRLCKRVVGMDRFLPCGYRLWRNGAINLMNLDISGRQAGFLLSLDGLSLERI